MKIIDLYEVFNNPVEWVIVRDDANAVKANFSVNGKKYQFSSEKHKYHDGTEYYEIFFKSLDASKDNRYSLLNDKDNPTRVYSTVVALIKYVIDKYSPEHIQYYASDERTIRVYDYISKILSKVGYEVEFTDDDNYNKIYDLYKY